MEKKETQPKFTKYGHSYQINTKKKVFMTFLAQCETWAVWMNAEVKF